MQVPAFSSSINQIPSSNSSPIFNFDESASDELPPRARYRSPYLEAYHYSSVNVIDHSIAHPLSFVFYYNKLYSSHDSLVNVISFNCERKSYFDAEKVLE